MNIHTRSIFTAGGVAALAGLIVSVLLALPLRFGIRTGAGPDPIGLTLGFLATVPLLTPFLCAGFALLPLAAGFGYAALAHRAQPSAANAWGGALAGAFGGLVYGLLASLISLAMQSGAAAFLQDVQSVPSAMSSLIGLSVSVGGAILGGLMFGALGAGLWLVWQRRSVATDPAAPSQNRRPASLLLSGCGALVLSCGLLASCALVAVTADAAYWSTARRNPRTTPPAPASTIVPGSTATPGGVADINTQVLQAELDALPPGDAARGEQVFATNACHACHCVEAGVQLVGPSLAGIGANAATRKPGYSAELYLYESIVHPDAYTVEGFQSGLMPAEVAEQLSKQQLADLIAYLMTK